MAGPFKAMGRVFSTVMDAATAVSKTAYAAQEAADGLISMASKYAVEQKNQDRKDLEKIGKDAVKEYEERMKKAELKFLDKD